MLDTSNTQMLSYLGNEVVFEHVKLLCHHTDNGSKSRTKSLLSSMFRRSSETQRKKRDAVYARGLNVINGGCHGNLTEPLLNLKSKETANILKAALQSLIFAASHDELDKTLFAMKRLDVAPNEVIITQGDVGDKFYVVQSGVLEVSVNGSAVGKLLTGDHFGELALIYDAPRAATIVATTPAVLWTLDRDEFRMIQAQSSNDTLLQRATWLRQVDLLASLSERQLALLAGLLKAVKFEDEDCIVRQGDVGENFYIIEEGEAVCRALGSPLAAQSGETEVARFGPGDYFGELALLSDMPRNASVYAQGLVKCLSLDRQAFVSMLGPLAEVLEHNSRLRILKATPELSYLSLDDLEYLVSQLEFETYGNNECVYREGDDADAFYIIKSGSVQLVTVCEDPVTGQLIPRGVLLGASDVFGIEMLQQYHGAYKHTAVASGGAQILCLPATALKLLEKALYADDEMDAQQITSKYGRIAFEDIQQGPIIAEGSFARVHIAHVPVEGEPVPQPMALKVMSKAHIVNLRVQGHVMCEKEALSVLPSHPSIIELYGTYQDQDNLYMLLEFVPGGELLNLLDNDELLTEDAARFYAANALLGLQHMHAHDIMYRDLKPENLLLGKDGYLKFVDFGFAKRLPFVSVDEDGTEHLQTRTYTLCGTPDYLAPEHILCRGHDQAVDYWTLGVLIYEMLVGYTPFSNAEDDKTEMYRKIARVGTGEDRVRFPSHMIQSPDAKDLIRRLLQGDPSNRLGFGINGAKEIREHPWFSSIDWDALLLKQIPPPYVPELKADDDVSRFMGQSGDRVWDLPFDGVGDEFFVGF